MLRPNEAILGALLAGMIAYHLRRGGRPHPVTGLDLAVGSFTIGGVLIAVLVLFLTNPGAMSDTDTLRMVLAPLQFLAVYLVFSRADLSSSGVETLLKLTMLASLIVGVVAMAELANLPGVRSAIAVYFPPDTVPIAGWDMVFRPTSTLGHFSSVGAFAAFNFILALGLLTYCHPAFKRWWLMLVMTVNLLTVVASLTWAPLIALPLATAVVIWHARRVPRELAVMVLCLAAAFIIFWPYINARGTEQAVTSSAQLFVIPWTFQFRIYYWESFFLPALADHVWLGTGTVIPAVVPTRVSYFVDNEYLREAFRAGLAGLTLYLVMLATIARQGYRSRVSPDVMTRSLGGVALATVVFFLLTGMTAEYLFFGGISQAFAMLLGLLSAARLREASRSAAPYVAAQLPSASLSAVRVGAE
jgi:O-antigen ligase